MDTVLLVTPIQLIGAFLAICSGITLIAGAGGVIYKIIQTVRTPNRLQNEKLEQHEKLLEKHAGLLEKDNKRLAEIEEGNRLQQRGILALLSHGLNGNSTQEMKDVRDDLQKYLINK